jgi:predicted metal-dependent phosphoesterase TrpH
MYTDPISHRQSISKTFKGIMHVHSNYSYDGQHSLEEIAEYAKCRGYSFVSLAEHSDTFDSQKMNDLVRQCEEISKCGVLMIPGIEFSCENKLHIIGLGIQHYKNVKDPLKVAEFIHQQNGITIIAHPSRYSYKIPVELATVVKGIEVWNAAYDGRFVPNNKSLNLTNKIREKNGYVLAFGAQDFHRIGNHFNVETTISCNELEKEAILRSLKEGNFYISNPYFLIDSRCKIGQLKLAQILVARRIYYAAKWIRDHFVTSYQKA